MYPNRSSVEQKGQLSSSSSLICSLIVARPHVSVQHGLLDCERYLLYGINRCEKGRCGVILGHAILGLLLDS